MTNQKGLTQLTNQNTSQIEWVRLHPDAKIPTYATIGSVGLDLCCVEPVALGFGEHRIVRTGLSARFPAGVWGSIRDKSGVAGKRRVLVMGGVVDQDYEGEICVVLHNLGMTSQHFKVGDAIAQMVLSPVVRIGASDDVVRGEGGFGSTGR